MAKFIGNHGPYYRRGQTPAGVGVANIGPIIGSWGQVAGKSGEIVPVTVDQVIYDQVRIGIFVQASAAVTIRYSLDNIALAGSNDPDVRDNAQWTANQSLTAGDIVQVDPIIFTVAEITFGADAIVTFYAR